ncbi:MAG: hypothetical protein WA188_07500 [Terriglobales bacterium]
MSLFDTIRRRAVADRKNPLRAAWSLGRELVHLAGLGLAGSPTEMSAIVMSAALGFLFDRLPARAASVVLRAD